MYKGKRKLLSNHLKVENLCTEKKDKHVIDLGIYTVMVIKIYIVKKNFKTKVNGPRKMGKCYEYMICRRANTNGQQTWTDALI